MARRWIQGLLLASTAGFSWLAMMAVHELGHVLHALATGGIVTKVVLHPLAISRTDVDPNPAPHVVAWGGAIWGCLLPLVVSAWAGTHGFPWRHVARFFAGFCFLVNGAYLGSGVWFPVGDAADLLRLGTPPWILGTFGLGAMAAGLWCWNGLGPQFGLGPNAKTPNVKSASLLTAIVIVIVVLECALSERQ